MERLDDLIIDDLKIYQREDEFRFSFDAIALVRFCKFNSHHRYIDLGTGTGVIPLIGTSLGAGHITGIELNPVTTELARRSVVYNHKEQEVTILERDYRQLDYHELGNKPFDGIIANPPYFNHVSGLAPQDGQIQLALHDGHTTLMDVCNAAKRLIKHKGRFWMVYSAPRLQEAFVALENTGFRVKRLRMVHGMIHKPAKIVLIESIQQGQLGITVEPPLIVYKEPNVYTEEVTHWYERT